MATTRPRTYGELQSDLRVIKNNKAFITSQTGFLSNVIRSLQEGLITETEKNTLLSKLVSL